MMNKSTLISLMSGWMICLLMIGSLLWASQAYLQLLLRDGQLLLRGLEIMDMNMVGKGMVGVDMVGTDMVDGEIDLKI
jgi:hypothetical protein